MFELKLPKGPHSVLGAYLPESANGSFCNLTKIVTAKQRVKRHGHTVTMKVRKSVLASPALPTKITAQNGAVIKQATKLAVTGCPVAKKASAASSRAARATNHSQQGPRHR
jgi:hypothetical protein